MFSEVLRLCRERKGRLPTMLIMISIILDCLKMQKKKGCGTTRKNRQMELDAR